MNDHGQYRLWSIPGDGVLARQGNLVLLISIDDRGFAESLLELLTRTNEAGGDGRALADAIGAAVERHQAWGGSQVGPAIVAFGPAGSGLAFTVSGSAFVEISSSHGKHRLVAGHPSMLLKSVVAVPVETVRGGLGGNGPGDRTDRFTRLDSGTVRAWGLSYAALPEMPGAAPAGERGPVRQAPAAWPARAPAMPAAQAEAAPPPRAPAPSAPPAEAAPPSRVPAHAAPPAEAAPPRRPPAPPPPAEAAPPRRPPAPPPPAEAAPPRRPPAPPPPPLASPAADAGLSGTEEAEADEWPFGPSFPAEPPFEVDPAATPYADERGTGPFAEEPTPPIPPTAEPGYPRPAPGNRTPFAAEPAAYSPAEHGFDEPERGEPGAARPGPGPATMYELGLDEPGVAAPAPAPQTSLGPAARPAPEPPLEQADTDALTGENAGSASVLGVHCKNGHFTDPDARSCVVCGTGMRRRSAAPERGPRPPLGVLILEDGATVAVDGDYIVGRDPGRNESVSAGEARPLRVVDAESTVSRIHAEVHLDGWQVLLTDLGSANGTRVRQPGAKVEQQLDPRVPMPLQHGARIFVGASCLRYERTGG